MTTLRETLARVPIQRKLGLLAPSANDAVIVSRALLIEAARELRELCDKIGTDFDWTFELINNLREAAGEGAK